MWQRRWVTVHFSIDDWLYRGKLYCSVNINAYGEFIDPDYCEDMEYIEDVELLGADNSDNKILGANPPKEEAEITIEDVYNCSSYKLFI